LRERQDETRERDKTRLEREPRQDLRERQDET